MGEYDIDAGFPKASSMIRCSLVVVYFLHWTFPFLNICTLKNKYSHLFVPLKNALSIKLSVLCNGLSHFSGRTDMSLKDIQVKGIHLQW